MVSIRQRTALLDQVIPMPVDKQLEVAAALAVHWKPSLRAMATTVTKMALAKLEERSEQRACKEAKRP